MGKPTFMQNAHMLKVQYIFKNILATGLYLALEMLYKFHNYEYKSTKAKIEYCVDGIFKAGK